MIENFDFIIVGAGMAGASLGAELSSNHRVVLLEQEERAGYHATGRSAALHIETYGNAVIRALTRTSLDFFLSGDHAGVAFATPRGCLYVASKDQLARLAAFARDPDIDRVTSWLSAAEARERVPVLRTDYVAAALIERDAYDLDVNAIHRFFLRCIKANGGDLICSKL